MSLQWQLSREVPDDTQQVGDRILPPDNLYRQIGDRFDRLFPAETVFEPLYASQGRGAVSPLLLALVTVLQMLEVVPDRVAAGWVVTRLDWKYALHLPLGYPGFHFTDLYAFRTRLVEHHQERLLLDQVLAALQSLGLLQRRGKLRTDSTHVLGLVERLSQVELVGESLRVALRAVGQQSPGWVQTHLPVAFQELYRQLQSEYGLSPDQVRHRLSQTGRDAFWFLAQLDQSGPPAVQQLPEVGTLRQVLAQQFPQGPSGPPASRRPGGGEVIESPHEPEARFGQKRGQPWLGYKAQVSETCDDQAPHLVVDLEATSALANDSPQLPAIQARLLGQGLCPQEHYVDQGYMSGANLAASARAGIRLVGVPLEDTARPPGLRQADFAIDEAAHTATCPAGQPSRVWSEQAVEGAPQPQVQVRFTAATCRACRFWGVCTTSPQGRSLTLHPYRTLLDERRREAATPAFRQQMHRRAGIEGTLSELVRGHGLRHARYRGQAKLRLQGYFTAVAIDVKRLVRWWVRRAPPVVAPG
jgi:transposase